MTLGHKAGRHVHPVSPALQPPEDVLPVEVPGLLVQALHHLPHVLCDQPPGLSSLHPLLPQIGHEATHVQRPTNVNRHEVTRPQNTRLRVVIGGWVGEDRVHAAVDDRDDGG